MVQNQAHSVKVFDTAQKRPYIEAMETNDTDNVVLPGLFIVAFMAFFIWFGLSISVRLIWVPPSIFLALAFGSGFLDAWEELTSDEQSVVNQSGERGERIDR
jgi:hypothetical protein